MLYFTHKGDDNVNEIKYIDSYDNEGFAPQFWEEEKCTSIITPIHTKTEWAIV